MTIQEIKDRNKVNMDKLSVKQLEFLLNKSGLKPEPSFMFKSNIRFDKYVRVAGMGYELRKSKPDKYVCTLILWDKEIDDCFTIIRFGFNNRNRLRNRLQTLHKQYNNIACCIISINEVCSTTVLSVTL